MNPLVIRVDPLLRVGKNRKAQITSRDPQVEK